MRTSEAADVFHHYLAAQGPVLDELTAEQAVDTAIGFFQSERVDDVEDEMGDMLLVQWGTYDWRDSNGPSFQFEMARQFVVAGVAPEDADDAMWQLRLTLHYAPSEVAAAVGEGNRWCEKVGDGSEFRTFIRGTEAMAVAATATPDRVELSLDQVG